MPLALAALLLFSFDRPAAAQERTTSRGDAIPGPASPPPESRVAAASPFFVWFQNAPPPRAPGHLLARPGPSGARADRAGYTTSRLMKRLTVRWGEDPPDDEGRVPIFAQNVNVVYRQETAVEVSSDFRAGSCAYQAVVDHEGRHVAGFLRLFHDSRAPLVALLESHGVPTRESPLRVEPGGQTAAQDRVANALAELIRRHGESLRASMETHRDGLDSAASYRGVYDLCPPADWGGEAWEPGG